MTPSVQNLNAKLTPRPAAPRPAAIRGSSRPPAPTRAHARITGRPSSYRGGYRINV
jgi:hypothetical protein